MGFRRKLAATVLSLCGGTAACTAFCARRSRQLAYAEFADAVTMSDYENMTLINVQIFFRHGARTPLTIITGLKEVCIARLWLLCRLEEVRCDRSWS